MIQLMKYLGEYKKRAVMTPIWVILETVCELFLTVTIGRFIDELSSSETTMALIYEYGIRLVVIAALCLVFGTICGWESVKAASGLSKNLRNAMFDRIQDFSFTNIDRFSTNSLVTRMTTDVANVQNAFMMMLRVAAKAPVSIACALVMAFSINWKIGLVYIIVIPILLIGLLVIARVTHPIFERVFHTYDRLNGVVREDLHGIRVVKGFVREDYETEKFKGISEDIRRDFTKAETTIAFNPFLMQFSIYLCLVLISWFSARAIVGVSGGISMTTGDLQNLITYAMMILMSLMMLSMIYVMTMISRECVSRIREVLAEKPTIEAPESAVRDIENGQIDFEHVGFSYADDPGKLCLSDIDLHIKSGETIGVIGGTGSGKSSLVQLIPRLYDATVGSVKVAGRDVREYDIEALRDAVAVVLQKNVLFAGTIMENIRYGRLDATDEECVAAAKLSGADSFITRLPQGYDTVINGDSNNLSQGQCQLISIARAAVADPPVMILDEATSSIDTRTEAIVQDGMDRLMEGRTVFVIAHRLSTVRNSKAIMVLELGRIIERGSHEQLMEEKGQYYQLYTGAFELE